jgi:hypothetical protein
MAKLINTVTLQNQHGLQEKILELYELNKSYINEAEKFLLATSQGSTTESNKESLHKKDVERLYSHVFVMEHIAKLLYEEFLINKNGGLPERSSHDSDRR